MQHQEISRIPLTHVEVLSQKSCGSFLIAPTWNVWYLVVWCPPAYSPLQVTDYLCDTPLLLQLLVRGLGTMGGLVWLFLFRVALCCVGTVMSIISPALDAVSSSSTLETDPSLCGLLGLLDDLVVVILLLICVININQQITPERGQPGNATTSQGVMGDSL